MRLAKVSDLLLFKQDFAPNFCKDSLSKSFKALTLHGWIAGSYNGGYYILPQLQRSIEKLSSLIASKMDGIGGLRVALPLLCKSSLLEQSNRWKAFPELFTLKDRKNGSFALVPTCEEGICHLVTTLGRPIPESRLPLMLYQINTKFRDELHPRNGLLRGREFLMKDMYSFDQSQEQAEITYNKVVGVYHAIFRNLDLKYHAVEGSVGLMGGSASHEFHVASDAGENDLLICKACRTGYNIELLQEQGLDEKSAICQECRGNLERNRGIEIGHTFLLGKKYSEAFNIKFKGANNTNGLAWMGCYGIGVSRLIAACVEQFGTDERIALPPVISPYLGVIIPQKEGHKFTDSLQVAEKVASAFAGLPNASDFLFDERHHLSIGRRLLDSFNAGIPLAIVAGKSALESPARLEVYWRPHNVIKQKAESPLFLAHENEVVELAKELFRKCGVNMG